jgi:hypothetical protein
MSGPTAAPRAIERRVPRVAPDVGDRHTLTVLFQPSREVSALAALRCGEEQFPLPRVLTLDKVEAEDYWMKLGRSGLRHPYGSHPAYGPLEFQYGTAVDIAPGLGAYLAGAVREIDGLVKGYIREAGGLTRWLSQRAPVFGDVQLCFGAVNRLLESLLEHPDPSCRMQIPLILDPIVTVHDGTPSLRIVEMQSGFGYPRLVLQQLEALGLGAMGSPPWAGSVEPLEALSAVRALFATPPQDVSVLATITGHLPDEAGWASYLSESGLPRGLFIPTDLERDEQGWYHLEYEADPDTGVPRFDAAGRPIRTRPAEKRRITHVVALQPQSDLDEIHAQLTPSERAQFLEFLADGDSVRWIFPHAAWYIADKSLMQRVRADLLERGSVYAELFVPVYSEGERIDAPGSYVLKPTYGDGGCGVKDLYVETGTCIEVPVGFVAQERFEPYPLPLRLSAEFASGFPVPEPRTRFEHYVDDPCFTTATVELRVMTMPGSTEMRDSFLFMARVAPTWDPGELESAVPVMTNQREIQRAIWNSPAVRLDNHHQLPFGWCAVSLGASLE